MKNQETIQNELIELCSEYPNIHFDEFDESSKYVGIYYARGIGEAIDEWDLDTELADVTIYWDPKTEEAELIIEEYND